MPGAVYFDLDGTLVDTKADLCATVNHTRRDLGLDERPVGEIICHVGLGARHLLAQTIPERADDVDELWRIFMSHYGEHVTDNAQLYPHVAETLEELRSRGWVLGVNTAKPAFATHALLAHLGIAHYFGEAVVAGGDCDEMKPSAAPLKLCAQKAGRDLSPCDWMVGDNWTDIECAANAGVGSIFCRFGFGVLRASQPAFQVSSFNEILRVICRVSKKGCNL